MLVQIKGIKKVFSSDFPPALDHIDAEIPAGQIVGLVGPDGAGKTTLIRLVAALLSPTEGEIIVDGNETMRDPEPIHAITGYMPQKFGLYEDLTVIQNLNLYAEIREVEKKEKGDVFKKLLHFTGLDPFQNRLARALSGGMKQKLGLACALVKKPKLLLLDEPSVGVDPLSRRELWGMVEDLLDEGISVVWSTAYLDEAEKCQTVLLLNEGKLLYKGDPKGLTERVEGHVFLIEGDKENRRKILREVLREENVLDGVIQGSSVRIVVKELSSSIGNYPVKKTSPRFEDAFITILGGGPGGESELADSREEVKKREASVVEAKELTRRFGEFTAADRISFSVHQGEVFGLLGPNGAGKSTTFKMLCGLLKPTQGEALINGLNVQKVPSQARGQLGYMAQKFSLYTSLTVYQNLEFFSGIYNLQGNQQKKMIDEMIEVFALQKYLNTSPDLLPLGFKQRLSLACATMHAPPLLFLDEPTSGVDPITRREFWNHINGLVEKGVTVLVTTHFMDEAEYCDRIALIYRGKVINLDSPDALKAKSGQETLEAAFIKLIQESDENSKA